MTARLFTVFVHKAMTIIVLHTDSFSAKIDAKLNFKKLNFENFLGSIPKTFTLMF